MKHLDRFESYNEGKTFRANKGSDNKIELIKSKVKEHINSIDDVEIGNVGNDITISIDGNKVGEIMFRDNYIGLRKEGQKFVDELGYNELGKIKFKINSMINSAKKDQ